MAGAGSCFVSRILSNSVAITKRAAQIAREVSASGDLGIRQKNNDKNDLQTRADRRIQDCISVSLRTNFPGLTVIGEEGDVAHQPDTDRWIVGEHDEHAGQMYIPDNLRHAPLRDFTVWIDPLDGTKEFAEGTLHTVTILVGIAIGDKAVAGVINQPFYGGNDSVFGRTIYGVVGSGVRGIGRKWPPSDQRIVTTTRFHGSRLVDDVANACKPTEVLRVGGAGYKVIQLIEGQAHVYAFPNPGCKKWDTCGPEAVLHAYGGRLTDIYGNCYKYNSTVNCENEGGILATGESETHAEYLRLIPMELKDKVKDFFYKKSER